MGFFIRTLEAHNSMIYYHARKSGQGNSVNVKYSTGISIPTKLWNKHRVKRNLVVDYKGYNTTLTKIEEVVDDLFSREDFKNITNSRVKNALDYATGKSMRRNKTVLNKSFSDFYKDELEDLRLAQIGEKKDGSSKIRRDYVAYKAIGEKINASRMDWEDFDFQWMGKFQKRLEAEGRAHSSIGTYFKQLKAILNKGKVSDYNKFESYRRFKLKKKAVVDKPYLNEEQLREIFDLKLPKGGHLDIARDIFILGCWTGMRVGNYNNLDIDKNFVWDKGYIQYGQIKTGSRNVVPIHWTVKELYKKNNNGLPPKMSIRSLNMHVKVIAELAGLTENYTYTEAKGGKTKQVTKRLCDLVTSHTARRSLCTNLYLGNVPVRMIMVCSGHENEATCLHYIKADSLDLLEQVMKLPIWKKPKGKQVNMKKRGTA